MTETRLKELQTEIARLEELDTKTTNRVNNEFEEDLPCDKIDSAELDNFRDDKVECSLELDYEFQQQSE